MRLRSLVTTVLAFAPKILVGRADAVTQLEDGIPTVLAKVSTITSARSQFDGIGHGVGSPTIQAWFGQFWC